MRRAVDVVLVLIVGCSPVMPFGDFESDSQSSVDSCAGCMSPAGADGDGDTVRDEVDNCPAVANFDQADSDGDGRGDACPAAGDVDGDRAPDGLDNCAQLANPDQRDTDNDFVGDACDNCPTYANTNQLDADANGVGDACQALNEADPDGDGLGIGDNCPNRSNVNQLDGDGDGVGDACDNCAAVPNPFQEDVDLNGIGDHCDAEFRFPSGASICAEGSTSTRRVASNLYLLMDLSSSMTWDIAGNQNPPDPSASRWAIVTSALDRISDELAASFNIGVGGFPAPCANQAGSSICLDSPSACSEGLLPHPLLPTQTSRDGSVLRGAYSVMAPYGTTPTATALRQVLINRSFEVESDALGAGRASAVVLITDGEPNSAGGICNPLVGDLSATVQAAAELAAEGVPVYVIGIAGVNEAAMEQIAVAGGGSNPLDPGRSWFSAANVEAITSALQHIGSATVGCSVAVTNTGSQPPDWGRASVSLNIDGASVVVAPDSYRVHEGSPTTVELLGQACADLRAAVERGADMSVEIRAGCTSQCRSVETCGDNADNDCDGVIDGGCPPSCRCLDEFDTCNGQCPTRCVPAVEICDTTDNDCDGQEDNGCCVPTEEVCDGFDNDCDGRADEGCDEPMVII